MNQLQKRLVDLRHVLPAHVRLVAVSKYHPASAIQEAYEVGQRIFGESRVQELQEKYQVLPADIEWHFIGHLQQNKVKYIAPYISLVHAVDSLRLLGEIDRQAKRFEKERAEHHLSPKIKVLLQLHVAQEETKFGFSPDECWAFLKSQEWQRFDNVEICGIMCMASNTEDTTQITKEFHLAHEFFLKARQEFFADSTSFTECSWGMSDDYPLAIENGSTLIRVGSYLFGPRVTSLEQKEANNQACEEAAKLYQEGLEWSQRSEWGKAATCFRKALALDPQSPAKESLSMITDILNYYHKDNFNP